MIKFEKRFLQHLNACWIRIIQNLLFKSTPHKSHYKRKKKEKKRKNKIHSKKTSSCQCDTLQIYLNMIFVRTQAYCVNKIAFKSIENMMSNTTHYFLSFFLHNYFPHFTSSVHPSTCVVINHGVHRPLLYVE